MLGWPARILAARKFRGVPKYHMLYPLTIFETLNENDAYLIPNGSLFAFPITIGSEDIKNILVVHTAGTTNQDHSLRCWVSPHPGGMALDVPPYLQMWHANRNAQEIITVYSTEVDEPSAPYPLPVVPGIYYLNVLNLVGRMNAFSYVLTDFE